MNTEDSTLKQANHLAQVINSLAGLWTPHEGQVKIGRALFLENLLTLFIQCGRKFGKTEILAYIFWRWCNTFPNQHCYYMAPYQKQAKEIIWATNRIQLFGPQDWIESVNNSEMRITFTNGSFLKVDGSDNYEAYRGINPHLMGYDEFKDFRPEFHKAMKPNLLPNKAPLIILGTPPDHECQYTEVAEEVKRSPTGKWFQMPSSTNPHISKEWLETERENLIRRGDEAEWLREYMGQFVKGGKRAIFPMIHEIKPMKRKELFEMIKKDVQHMEFFVITDPGSTTCHASLFSCYHPYKKKLYLIDEIYERDQRETSTRKIGGRIIDKVKEISAELNIQIDGSWTFWRDEAAVWFEVEMADLFGEPWIFTPVSKAVMKKEVGISTVKDMMIEGKLSYCEEMTWFQWEAENYVSDEYGKIPKENDHLMDALRYNIHVIGADLNPVRTPDPDIDRGKRAYTMEDDLEYERGDDNLLLGGYDI